MLVINKLLKPNTIEEALRLLKDNKKAHILGGGAFLRLSSDLKINVAIDLYGLGIDQIEETDNEFIIGAMTTLRDLEVHKILNPLFSNSVENIVGVQLRNIATIGGTIFPKYAFSDLITSLLVLDTKLLFEGKDDLSLEAYLLEDKSEKCILKSIIIKKEKIKTSFKTIKNSASDYAILNAAVSVCDGKYKVAVGARPSVSSLAYKTMDYLNQNELTEETIEVASDLAMNELTFGNNRLGSEGYRKDMCKVLVKRALMEVMSC